MESGKEDAETSDAVVGAIVEAIIEEKIDMGLPASSLSRPWKLQDPHTLPQFQGSRVTSFLNLMSNPSLTSVISNLTPLERTDISTLTPAQRSRLEDLKTKLAALRERISKLHRLGQPLCGMVPKVYIYRWIDIETKGALLEEIAELGRMRIAEAMRVKEEIWGVNKWKSGEKDETDDQQKGKGRDDDGGQETSQERQERVKKLAREYRDQLREGIHADRRTLP